MDAIGPINTWNPGAGPVVTWTASASARQAVASSPVDDLPATFQQSGHLRAAFYGRQLGRELPRLMVVSWDIPGICDIAAMTEAITTHVRRHDTYHSAFEVNAFEVYASDAQDVVITRRTLTDTDRIEFTPVLAGFMSPDQIREHVTTTTPNTLEWDCFSFGVVQNADHFSVYASIDHLHIDLLSGAMIFADIHSAYAGLTTGQAVELPPVSGYRDYNGRQQAKMASMTLESTEIQEWIDFARDTDGQWPSFPLPLGDAYSTTAGSFVTEELLDAEQTRSFDTACRAAGARFSGGVMACAALAEHRLIGTETFHGFTPSDTRVPGTDSMSVGWFASLFPVTVPVADNDFTSAARAAQESFDTSKHLSSVHFERVTQLASLQELGIKPPSKSAMMVSYADFRKMACAELIDRSNFGTYGDNLSHGGVNVWINRHTDATTVTVSLPDNAEAHESVARYISVLKQAFAEAAGQTESWINDVTVHANSAALFAGAR